MPCHYCAAPLPDAARHCPVCLTAVPLWRRAWVSGRYHGLVTGSEPRAVARRKVQAMNRAADAVTWLALPPDVAAWRQMRIAEEHE